MNPLPLSGLFLLAATTAVDLRASQPPLYPLWDPAVPVPTAAELPPLPGIQHVVLKRREPEKDGYSWLHGVAIVRHHGVIYVCWGNNRGDENTPTEDNRGIQSRDDGLTWSPVEMIAPHTESDGRSHGVFLSTAGRLWLFLGRFGDDDHGRKYARLRTEAFALDEGTGKWESRGVVANLFWPYQQPNRMKNGNWIMGGMIVPAGGWARPGVAISHGDNLTRWDTVEIPTPRDMGIWGETAVIVDPKEILAIIRGGKDHDRYALVSFSPDFGATWSVVRDSNLPMTTSKPYAGILSTGQRFLICNDARDHGGKRYPLTIAVGRPGQTQFCRMWQIDDGVRSEAGQKTHVALAYPYAVEINQKLYVVYSSARGPGNRNDAELAVFPISDLAVAPPTDNR